MLPFRLEQRRERWRVDRRREHHHTAAERDLDDGETERHNGREARGDWYPAREVVFTGQRIDQRDAACGPGEVEDGRQNPESEYLGPCPQK